ncbi:type I restriction endonuclease subunit R [Spirosoma spitsbergense]|uniref:type I restriction endonuclease subunit R n=1 Tax=Spirosoma spitsbergense TaxID=431554 RepID=UPI0003762FA6|nr:type I restriction endonuclease subunit R [Spirosoma spitsbergense]
MSEYLQTEKPFLTQLHDLGWTITNQPAGIPQDPTRSDRSSFKEVTLKAVFKQAVYAINVTEGGQSWLTDAQLETVYEEVTTHTRKPLIEANKAVWEMLLGKHKIIVDKNELTGEESVPVRLIDFTNPGRNSFKAINQFRIDTPGMGKGFIIPDIVLFVNGLPLVVVECKVQNEFTANPLDEAVKQLQRYSNQRETTQRDGLKEGEESLFWFNQFTVATYGEKAYYGTITASKNHYYEWKDIYPERYKTFTPPLGKVRSQETLIQGMLPPDTLLDIVQHFTLFKPEGNGRESKVVARYQQFRAVGKTIRRLLDGQTPLERSGVIWHTQGSGKSLTMVMLVRKLRSTPALQDYKVLLVNDRIDLEDQLGETATLTGEKIDFVETTAQLKAKLATPSSNVVMVMIHKFQERVRTDHSLVGQVLRMAAEPLPTYGQFGEVNRSEKILILIDEAHRSQGSDMGNNIFEAFPNSTKIAFTGTPLITDRHKKKTHERFGSYIDQYKLTDAVRDGATLQILYEGKTSDDAIRNKSQFESKFDDLVSDHTPEEIERIKKKYGTYGDILEAEKRIEAIATDLVDHYVDNILVNGFKAQVVASSVLAAVRYKRAIEQAIQTRLETERTKAKPNPELIEKIAFLKVETVVSSQGTNEDAIITNARKSSLANKAVDNFKERFDYDKPLSGIALLVVCDMLLTGFDAPIEQIMYLDKKMKEHNLLQAIARVNRTYKGKTRGYVVDYIGNTNNLREALKIYSAEEVNDILDSFRNITSEIPILEQRYNRLIQLFREQGIDQIDKYVQQVITDPTVRAALLERCVELAEDVKFRADFEVYYKRFTESMDIVLPHAAANTYKIPAQQFAHLLFTIRQRYKDATISLDDVGEKIKQLINAHLINLGIDPKIPPIELFSDHFEEQISKNTNPKSVASEMEHAIRKHIKVSFDDDPSLYKKLYEKLEALLQQHQQDWEKLVQDLKALRDETLAGRKQTEEGVSTVEAPFFDLMIDLAFGKTAPDKPTRERCKAINAEIIDKLESTIDFIDFWNRGFEIEKIQSEISDIMLFSAIKPLVDQRERIASEVMALAKRRHNQLIGQPDA